MKPWSFENGVADTFDKYVREQLPWYDLATDATAYIVKNYVPQGGLVVDFGSSLGNMIAILQKTIQQRDVAYTAIDNSAEMADRLHLRFAKADNVCVMAGNAMTLNYGHPNVSILFLTMMFFPVAKRAEFLRKLVSNTESGGCIIIVDKVCDHRGYFSTVMKRLAWHWKVLQGAKSEDIVDKELALAGVQIPIDSNLLNSYGAQEFFRMGEFAGWVIEV
jgi:tRNA (cmo5U34)-methyltransferase